MRPIIRTSMLHGSVLWLYFLEQQSKLYAVTFLVLMQAFLIAFTSDFIQKLVYKYEYGERGTMKVNPAVLSL